MTVTKRGLQRFHEYRDRIKGIISQIEESPEPNPVLLKFFGLVLENDEKTIDCIEHDKPLLSSWYGSAPEIYAAWASITSARLTTSWLISRSPMIWRGWTHPPFPPICAV